MIGRNKIFAIFSLLIYVVLLILQRKYYLTAEAEIGKNCSVFGIPCIRFCSIDGKSDSELLEQFNKSDYLYENHLPFIILRGEPECIDMEIENSAGVYIIKPVSLPQGVDT